MEDELFEDLKAELSATDENFNKDVLLSKIKAVIREIKSRKEYPSYYTDAQIESDMGKYYSNARNQALYDYNLVGAEGQTSHSENGVSRGYGGRWQYLVGIIPIARIV